MFALGGALYLCAAWDGTCPTVYSQLWALRQDMMKSERGHKAASWLHLRKTAPFWGAVVGVTAVLVYWPGIIGVIPGLGHLYDLKPLRHVDLRIGDRLHPWFAAGRPSKLPRDVKIPKICVVGITCEELTEFGSMPWDRRKHGDLVRCLRRKGADIIAFDIYFPNPGKPEEDAAFAQACREAGNVILPRWAFMPESEPRRPLEPGHGLDDCLCHRDETHAVRFEDGVFRGGLREAAEQIYESALDCGHMNIFYDDDLVARRVPVAIGESGNSEYYLPLGVVAAMSSRGVHPSEARIEHDALVYGSTHIPLDCCGCVIVNYQRFGRAVDIKSPEILKIESDVSWLREADKKAPIQFYSYLDVLEGRTPPDAFEGAVVLVGQTVQGSREDVHVTPYGNQFGVFVQAMLVYSTLAEQFLSPLSQEWTVLAVLLLSVLLGTICFSLRFRGSTYAVIGGGCIIIGLSILVAFSFVGFLRAHGLVLDATPFLLVMGFNLIGGIASSASRTTREADIRNREMDMLLLAGQRHVARWLDQDALETRDIEGAGEIAISASLSLRSPDIVAETFWQAVPCEGCALFLVGEGKSLTFERTVFLGFKGGLSAEDAKRLAVRVAWETLQTSHPITHSRRDPDWPYGDIAPAARNLAGVSMTARGQALATVLLFNKRPTATSPGKDFTEDDLHLAVALRYQAAALLENARRYRLEYAMLTGFAESLAKAVDFRDRYTHGHSERVAEFSVAIARKLGLTEAEVEIVQRAATLHDVGKIGVSDAILNKPGRLSDEEFAMIRAHAVNGYEILKAAPSFEALLPGIRSHHERYDGGGYPDGLAGREIPLIARIIAAADAYDAMTSERIYRTALPEETARQELIKGTGGQFDPLAVEAFLKFLRGRVGSRAKRAPEPEPSGEPIESPELVGSAQSEQRI